MIFSFWCVCLVLGVLVLRKFQKAKGYSFFFPLILVCSLKIYKLLSFFFFFWCLLGAWCLVAEKMWESKGK